jgi:hypothetical protein
MGLLEWLRLQRLPRPSATVSFDESGIRCERADGSIESVLWSDLQAVWIQTTDAGPFAEDVFWVLAGRESGCVVPSEAAGAAELLERLQKLPGFENGAVIAAMASTEHRQFVCWQRLEGVEPAAST